MSRINLRRISLALALAPFGLLALAASLTTPARTQTALPVGPMQWAVSGDDIYNANSGNVGVGTSAPTSKLTVFAIGTSAITGDLARIHIRAAFE